LQKKAILAQEKSILDHKKNQNPLYVFFCKVGGSMQKMSIYWEQHGSHNALIVGAGFHIFSCVEKGQELHNAMPFKG